MRDYGQEWRRRKAALEAKYPGTGRPIDLAAYEAWTTTAEEQVHVTEIAVPPAIWALSDTHVGARTFDFSLFREHKKRAADAGAQIIFGGDAIECVTTGSTVASLGAQFEQFLPDEDLHPLNWQVEAFQEYIGDFPVAAMVEGNHEARLARQGFNPIWELCRRLGAAYLGVLGVVLLGEASILVSHGEGGGQRHHQLRMRDYPGHDVYLGGHTHQLGFDYANDRQLLVRTGHYLGKPVYTQRQQYSGLSAPNGSVLLHLDNVGKVTNVEVMT